MAFNDFINYKCEYRKGLVAFLDILGFKQFISCAHPSDIYSLYMLISTNYEISLNNNINIAVFSDSIIITSEDVNNTNFMSACYLIINQIYWNFGLFVRGGISYGYYYCSNNISFGQAIVDAYLCEEDAKDIKIAIDKKALPFIMKHYSWCLDQEDEKYSINQFIFQNKIFIEMGKEAFKAKNLDIEKTFKLDRENIIYLLRKYNNTSLYSKYLWMLKSFNNFCDYLKQHEIFMEKIKIDEI